MIVTYKGTLNGQSSDFSRKTLQARREWNKILKMLKEKKKRERKQKYVLK